MQIVGDIGPEEAHHIMVTDDYYLGYGGVPIIGISRHRVGIDGKGVTTLVAFHGCQLNCKYCLNPQALGDSKGLQRFTPVSLLERVKIDDIYFRATGGGICFGGGEPLLQSSFIAEFKEICPADWKITVETSLHCSYSDLKRLALIVDHWIIDIKSSDDDVYEKYTGSKSWLAKENLKTLVGTFGVSKDNITLRVPIIPGFNTEEEANETAEILRKDFPNVEMFDYVTKPRDRSSLKRSEYRFGKAKCEFLKLIRKELAAQNGIEPKERKCTHKGDCPGSCPLCDFELEKLSEALERKGLESIQLPAEAAEQLSQWEEIFHEKINTDPEPTSYRLQGDPTPPEDWKEFEGIVQFEPPQYETIRRKVLFKECYIAGVGYHVNYSDEIWNELEEKAPLALIRDKKNPHDKNAVAVALADDYDGDPNDFDFDFILGYVPKGENEVIAQLLDMGWEDVFTAKLSMVKKTGNINSRLRMSIYIQSKDLEYVRPKLLRAKSLSDQEFHTMVEDLNQRGTAYFRFGGYPYHEFQFPIVGEKIVMVHHDIDCEVLYLMRVLAEGDDCAKYLKEPNRIIGTDDCAPFILSNIMGPLRIKKSDYYFIEGVDLKGFSATQYLSKEVSEGFEKIFDRVLFKTMNRNNIDSDPDLDRPEASTK